MIVRFGGGNSGIAEYLEKGSKYGRHYSRDELDNRIIIDGDLEITDKIINDITDKGQERYIHITLSFNEPDITVEKMQAAYEDYKSQFLTAYKDDEINTYAEIHWPKTQQLLDKSTNEMYDRFPHIHMVIPKQNLLTGGYTNPRGLYDRNMNMWEALQEDVNNRHGLKSPAHSPRISLENYKAVLDRHKIKEFNPKYKAAEVKRELFDTIEKQGVKNWQDFKDLVSSHGEVKIRNEGKATEYYAVKLPNNPKFTNLNNPIFSKEYIEKREIPHQPLTQYQIDNRLKQWEVVSKEIKYIDDASAAAKRAYKALDDEQKVSFLKKHETHFYEEYDEKELSESKYKSSALRSGYSKFDRGRETDRRSLHDLPTLDVVHGGAARGNLTRAELLLSTDEIRSLQLAETDSDVGLQRPIHTSTRVIGDKEQIKSLSSQIIFDIEESTAIEKANDLQLFKEIRTNLDPDLVLAYAQTNHLINPEDHKHFNAKDGSARISFGKFNYNVSDFFTKGLGLEWKETEVILKSLYEAQTLGVKVEPVSNNTLKECLIGFEEDIYSVKLEAFKRVSNTIDKDESLSIKKINARYFTENRRISKLEFTTWSERENLKSINAFEKLVAEENLKAIMFGNRQDANAIKYPFSDHFEKYLTQQKVIDMSLINDLKEKYAEPKETENELENSIGGKGFDFVLNGKEAARRAKLTANLARQGQPNTRYGYSFKELTPNQQKDSVVFSHGGKKLFETKANRTKVLGGLDFDKTATALVYSMQRYGNPLDIKGTEKFREQIIEVAARNELKVEFTDPALNDALKVRLEELQLEAANENSISAEDLELDKSLGERAAVDKAMLESKHREIEADLQQPNQAAVDLAAIAITQRLNAHEHEPITAETAALDTAVYNELKQTPALQAYFAVEMSKIGAANAEYRAEFIKNEPEEFMLANHAARKFTDELETAYQANKPQEELDLTLDEAALQELEAKQSTINQLDATKDPAKLDLEAMYQNELIGRALANQEQEIAFGDRAMQAWENNKQQEQLLVDKIAERIDSGDIKVEDLGLDVLSTDDRNSIANAYMKTTTISALTADDLLKLTGEEFTPPKFDLEQLNKTLLELEPVIGENLIPWEESSWQNEAVLKGQANPPEKLNLSALYAAELILHEDKRTDFGTATDTTALDAWDVSSKQYELLTARIAERLESGEIPSDLQSQAEPDYLDAAKDIVLATDFKTIDSEALKTLTGEDFERPHFESSEQWQPEAPVNAPEAIDKDVEKELYATPAFESEALDEPLELDPAAPIFEPATDLINEPTFDDSGAAALSRLESLQIERLKGGHSHQETFVTDDMLISIQKTGDGWQVLSGGNTGAMQEVLQTERLDDALDYYESNKTLGVQVEQATELEQEKNRPVLGSEAIEAQPIKYLSGVQQQAADIVVAQLKDLERIEINPVAAYVMEDAAMTLQDHGTATIERNQEGGWTVTATNQDDVYTFKSDDLEQAAKNFVSVSVPLNGMEESTWTPNSAKLELFKQNLEAHAGQIDGFAMADQAKQLDQHFDKYTEQQDLGEAVPSVSEFQSSTVETVIAQANYEQVTKEVEKYQDIFASAYMKDGYNDMVKGSLNEESKDSPRYVDEAQKGALALVVEDFKENNLAHTDGKAISISLEEFKADTQQLVNQELAAKGLPEFDIASYNKYENPIKIETLEALKAAPEPLSSENANAKNIVNELDSFQAPETEQEARTAAKAISSGLNELRGRPELGQAALVVVALVDSSPALQGEIAKIAEFDNFSPVVIETTREASQTMQMTQSTPDVDMEM